MMIVENVEKSRKLQKIKVTINYFFLTSLL